MANAMESTPAAPVRFQVVGMMTKLEERIAGMHRFCDHVRTAIFAESASLLREFRRVDVLVTVDDAPLPPARDRVESDGTAVLHMQSVGAASDGDELFPDFVYGGWWHIGLHDFDAFAAAMEAAAAAEPRPRHPQAFWIGNVEMSSSRAALVALSAAHPERVDARGIRWQHARGNVSEATARARRPTRG